jgi:hypothetical protein
MTDWDNDGDEDYTDGFISGLLWGGDVWAVLFILFVLGVYLFGQWQGWWP